MANWEAFRQKEREGTVSVDVIEEEEEMVCGDKERDLKDGWVDKGKERKGYSPPCSDGGGVRGVQGSQSKPLVSRSLGVHLRHKRGVAVARIARVSMLNAARHRNIGEMMEVEVLDRRTQACRVGGCRGARVREGGMSYDWRFLQAL